MMFQMIDGARVIAAVFALCALAAPAAAQNAVKAKSRHVMLINTGVAIEMGANWEYDIQDLPPFGYADGIYVPNEDRQVLAVLSMTKAETCDRIADESVKDGAVEVQAGRAGWIPKEFDHAWTTSNADGEFWVGCKAIGSAELPLSLIVIVVAPGDGSGKATANRVLSDILAADGGIVASVAKPGKPADGVVSWDEDGQLYLPESKLLIPVSTRSGTAWSAVRWRDGDDTWDKVWRVAPGESPIIFDLRISDTPVVKGLTQREGTLKLIQMINDKSEKVTWMPTEWSAWVGTGTCSGTMQTLESSRPTPDLEGTASIQLHAHKSLDVRRLQAVFADFAEETGRDLDEAHAKQQVQLQTIRLKETGLTAVVDTQRWSYHTSNKDGLGYDIFQLKTTKDKEQVLVESEQLPRTCGDELRRMVKGDRYQMAPDAPHFDKWPDTIFDFETGSYLACWQPKPDGPLIFVTVPGQTLEFVVIRDLARNLMKADTTNLRASINRGPKKTAEPKAMPSTGQQKQTYAQRQIEQNRRAEALAAERERMASQSNSRQTTSVDTRATDHRSEPVEWGPGLRAKTAAFTVTSYDDEYLLFGMTTDVFFGAREKPGLVGAVHAQSAIGAAVSPLLDLAAAGGVGLSIENLDAYATARLGIDWVKSDDRALEVPLSPYVGPQAGFLFASNRRRSFGLGINAAYLLRLDGTRTVLLEPNIMLGKFLLGGTARLYDDGHQAAGFKVGVAF